MSVEVGERGVPGARRRARGEGGRRPEGARVAAAVRAPLGDPCSALGLLGDPRHFSDRKAALSQEYKHIFLWYLMQLLVVWEWVGIIVLESFSPSEDY